MFHGDCAAGSFVTQRFFVMPSRQSLPSPTHTTQPSSLTWYALPGAALRPAPTPAGRCTTV